MEYSPDAWVVLRMSMDGGTPIFKILAGWYGGYGGADEWKLNSGITSIKETDTAYEVYGYSGSIYRCGKSNERMSGLTSSIYEGFQRQILDSRSPASIEIIEMKNIIESLRYKDEN